MGDVLISSKFIVMSNLRLPKFVANWEAGPSGSPKKMGIYPRKRGETSSGHGSISMSPATYGSPLNANIGEDGPATIWAGV